MVGLTLSGRALELMVERSCRGLVIRLELDVETKSEW